MAPGSIFWKDPLEMAKGRFLSRALTTSDRIGNASDRAFRIWTMCLPFTDRDGRLPGSPQKLLRQCFPDLLLSYRWTMPDVREAIEELVRVGLWFRLVDDDGEEFFRVFQFEKHQAGWRYDREAESEFTYSGPNPDKSGSPLPTTPDNSRVPVGSTPALVKFKSKLNTVDDPADPPVREKKKRPKKETRWRPSQAIDAHRLALGDPEYGRSELPGPDVGALGKLGCLDGVGDLDLFWKRSANNLHSKGLPVTMQAIVRSIAYLDPTGLPRRANGNGAEPASRSARRAQDVVSNINPDTVERYKREQGITDGS